MVLRVKASAQLIKTKGISLSRSMDCEPEEGAEYHAVVVEAPLYIEHHRRSTSVVIEEESTEPPIAVVEAPSQHIRSTTRSCALDCEPEQGTEVCAAVVKAPPSSKLHRRSSSYSYRSFEVELLSMGTLDHLPIRAQEANIQTALVDVADTMITQESSVEAAQPRSLRRSSGFYQ
jgi:hypothetical protein